MGFTLFWMEDVLKKTTSRYVPYMASQICIAWVWTGGEVLIIVDGACNAD